MLLIMRVTGYRRVHKGKFSGDCFANNHGAFFAQFLDDYRVAVWLPSRHDWRATFSRHISGIDDIFQPHGDAMQSAKRLARIAELVHLGSTL